MQSKLSAFCDKLIEAGWLAAVVAVPTVFHVYTSDRFELPKVALVRYLALLMVLAWIVGTVERWTPAGRDELGVTLRRQAARAKNVSLVLPALLLVAVTLLSSLTSIWPHGSFWGAYDRRQGACTILSYVVIALFLLGHLRTKAQLERLARMTVLGSLPVCLYALAQHRGLAPAHFVGGFGDRVSASLGNPIFLAAYLVMVIPLTTRQVIRSLRGLVAGGASLPSSLLLTGTYGGLLLVQLYVVLLTQSRGPVLAMGVGLILFLVLWALENGRRTAGLLIIGLAVVAGSALAVVNLSDTLSQAVRDVPQVGRLATIAGAATLEQRTLIWQGAAELSVESPLRLLLGYGPESMDLAFYGSYPEPLVEFEGPGRTADRSHNALFDALISTGLIGTAIYLFLICSVLYYGLYTLGLVDDGPQRGVLAALLAVGGVVGIALSWLLGGLQFFAAGISAGLLVGLFAYLALFLAGVLDKDERGDGHPLLVIACLSAVVAHFVEIQVGIPVTATRTLFWIFAGVLAAAMPSFEVPSSLEQSGNLPSDGSALPSADAYAADGWHPGSGSPGIDLPVTSAAGPMVPGVARLLPSACLMGLLLIATAFGFVTHHSDLGSEPFTIVLLLLVWSWAGLIVVGEASVEASEEDEAPDSQPLSFTDRTFVYVVPSLLSLLLYFLSHVLIVRRFPVITGIPIVYYAWLLVALVATGIALLGAAPLPERFWRGNRGWLYPVVALLVFGLILTSSLNLARADVFFYLGRFYAQSNRWEQSVTSFERAVGLAPAQERYHQFLGHAYLRMAQPRTPERPAWFQRSKEALQRAVQLSPLNPDHHGNLGNMHHAWADVTADPAQQTELLTIALEHYQESVRLAPQTHGRLVEHAIFDAHLSLANAYSRLGRLEEAMEEARAARDSAPAGRRVEADDLIARIEALQP